MNQPPRNLIVAQVAFFSLLFTSLGVSTIAELGDSPQGNLLPKCCGAGLFSGGQFSQDAIVCIFLTKVGQFIGF